MRFVPPSLRAGQRNQYQFQDVTQAPPAAQIDQSRGQGQERGSLARTSSHIGQIVCYHYRQPGHRRWECPQRQGSHGIAG